MNRHKGRWWFSRVLTALTLVVLLVPASVLAQSGGAPRDPSGLTATVVNATRVDLAWTDTSDNEEGFSIERGTGTDNVTFAAISSVSANVTTYSDTAVVANTSYTWRVIAKNAALGDSKPSNSVTATAAVPAPTLSTPANGSFTNNTTVELGWIAPLNVPGVSCSVQIDNNANFSSPEYTGTSSTTPDLAPGTYYWRMRASDNAGHTSAWSAVWQFGIDTTGPAAPMLMTPPRGDQLDTHNVKFEWNPVSDVSGVTYHIIVTSIATGDTVQEEEGLRDTSIEFLLYDDYYGWNVTATDYAGNEGETSTTWYFLVLAEEYAPPDVAVMSPNGVGTSPPEAAVTSPIGGEEIEGGSDFAITWYVSDANGGITSGHLMAIEIFFSADGGEHFDVVALLDYNPGAFLWHVPNIDTDLGLIKIITVNDDLRTGVDVSDASFIIVSDSSLPYGDDHESYVSDSLKDDLVIVGETLKGGETFAITWFALDDITSGPDLKVWIEFSHDNGKNFEEIVHLEYNPGIFRWYVPNINTNEGFIRIFVEDEDGKKGVDVSDAAFTIIAHPDLPFGLTVVDNVGGHVSLSWNSSGAFVTDFIVERSSDNFATIDATFTMPADARSCIDTSAKSGKSYSYRVFSANGFRRSSQSSSLSLTTAGPVAPPATTSCSRGLCGGGGSFSGGGGGGGGGGAAPALTTVGLTGMTSDPALKIDSAGKLQSDAKLADSDKKLSIAISAGTAMKDAAGAPLSTMTCDEPAVKPPAPPQQAVLTMDQLGPSGATFNPPIDLTMAFDPATLPAGASESDLKIAFWDGDKWLALESTVDAAANTVSAKVNHFTVFGILAKTPPPAAVVPPPAATQAPAPAPAAEPQPSIAPAPVPAQEPPPSAAPVAEAPIQESSNSSVVLIVGIIAAAMVCGSLCLLLLRKRPARA